VSTSTGEDRDRGRAGKATFASGFEEGGDEMGDNAPIAVIVGIDWATEEHQVCALHPSGQILGQRAFKHSGEGLSKLVEWLERLSNGRLEEVS
jgi:hypothetical protein